MLFSSIGFLFRFLPVFMLIYLIVPARFRNLVLLVGSLIFYGAGEPYFVLLLVFSVTANYGLSRCMFRKPPFSGKARGRKKAVWRRSVLIAALILDFGILFVFKYCTFIGFYAIWNTIL